MNSHDAHDARGDGLDRLTVLAPDPDRAERVRVRCRSRLGRSRRRAARTVVISEFAWRVLAPGVVAAICVLYGAGLVAATVRLQAVFH
jgi:hypothetical protein